MTVRDRFAVAALAVMLAVVGAAMFAIDASQSPEPTPILITPTPALTYREGVVGHPSSINPLTARTQADRDLVALVFRGLLRAGPQGAILPDLADSWTVSTDGLTYTFNLRSDARWEDGQPVTAADVAFTVGLAQDPDYVGPMGASWQGIKTTVVDATVVRCTLAIPSGGFLRQALLPILPQHLLAETAIADLADSDFSARPMGDGPFRIVELDNAHALLTRVAGYESASAPAALSPAASSPTATAGAALPASASQSAFGPGPGSALGSASAASPADSPADSPAPSPAASPSANPPGNLETMDLVFFDDQASAVASFRAGQLDSLGGLAPAMADVAAASPASRVVLYPSPSMLSVVLNQRTAHPEFGNLKVRRALLEGIDRPAILATTLGERGTVADVPLASWSSAYDPSAVVATPFDAAAARADLNAAGWTQGSSGWVLPKATGGYAINLLSPDAATNPVAFEIAGTVVKEWQALGLGVTLEAVDAADYGQRLANGTFDAAIVDYQLGLDPDVSPLLLSSQAAPTGSNLSGVSDKTLDGLLTGVRTTSDPTARQAAVSALETYVSTNVLMLPICFEDYEFVVSGRVLGPVANQIGDPSGRYWDVLDWRLAGDR